GRSPTRITLEGHNNFVNSVRFSPDSTRLASASDDQTVMVWESGNGKELLSLEGHMAYIFPGGDAGLPGPAARRSGRAGCERRILPASSPALSLPSSGPVLQFCMAQRTCPAGRSRPEAMALFDAHRGLVHHLVLRIWNRRPVNTPGGLDLDDLVQIGFEALWRAAQAFDETRGFRFTSYGGKDNVNATVYTLQTPDRSY